MFHNSKCHDMRSGVVQIAKKNLFGLSAPHDITRLGGQVCVWMRGALCGQQLTVHPTED